MWVIYWLSAAAGSGQCPPLGLMVRLSVTSSATRKRAERDRIAVIMARSILILAGGFTLAAMLGRVAIWHGTRYVSANLSEPQRCEVAPRGSADILRIEVGHCMA